MCHTTGVAYSTVPCSRSTAFQDNNPPDCYVTPASSTTDTWIVSEGTYDWSQCRAKCQQDGIPLTAGIAAGCACISSTEGLVKAKSCSRSDLHTGKVFQDGSFFVMSTSSLWVTVYNQQGVHPPCFSLSDKSASVPQFQFLASYAACKQHCMDKKMDKCLVSG